MTLSGSEAQTYAGTVTIKYASATPNQGLKDIRVDVTWNSALHPENNQPAHLVLESNVVSLPNP